MKMLTHESRAKQHSKGLSAQLTPIFLLDPQQNSVCKVSQEDLDGQSSQRSGCKNLTQGPWYLPLVACASVFREHRHEQYFLERPATDGVICAEDLHNFMVNVQISDRATARATPRRQRPQRLRC